VGAQVSGRKALLRMLGWREGRFTFSAERRAPTQSLSGPVRVLLTEGMRQVEALARDTSLPPREAEIRLAVPKSEVPQAVHPVTQEVLLLLEMYGRVHDIVEHCSHPDYQVLRTVQTLIERGLVVISRGESAWPAPRSAWLDPAALLRAAHAEPALLALYRRGVYLSPDELTGRIPVRRGSATFETSLAACRNPYAGHHLPITSSGSSMPMRAIGVKAL